MKNETSARIELIIAAVIFGTVGVFRRMIDLSSGFISFARAVIGAVFLILFVLVSGKRFNFAIIRKKLGWLVLSGAFLGFNWVLLFEAFNHTSVATATLCSYMAPIFVIAVSPFILKEKLILKKIICVIVAVVGIVFVSGVIGSGIKDISEISGVLLALFGATFYAAVVILNKKLTEVPTYDKTTVQLISAAVVLVPYILITEDVTAIRFDTKSLVMLSIMGVIHTGVTYVLYFGSINKLSAQTIGILSYIDPIVAIALSFFFLHEPIGIIEGIGAILILGACFVSEFDFKRLKKEKK